MIRFWLIILRVVCAIQLVITIYTSFFLFTVLVTDGGFTYFLQGIAFAFIAALPVRVFIVLGNNYPDKAIEGKARKNFNRVFLINVLLITFLLAFVIRDYREAVRLSNVLSVGAAPPSRLSYYYDFITSLSMLIIHLCILYSLFWLRKQINLNVNKKQFDFEMQNEKN
jgi:hypothetical protein